MPDFTLAQKVARLFMVGSDSPNILDEAEPFLKTGLGGLILFRHHVQPFETPFELREHLSELSSCFSQPFIAIDQEGGQVERLPFWLCPNNILPVAYGLKQDIDFCRRVNAEIARRLRWLGFTVNFTPTVDLDRNPYNPIIGVRAYGSQPQTVAAMARTIMIAYQQAGVLPVAKHFPGHGSGTVDSHHSLPCFEAWQADELEPYDALIADGLEAVLVAHGLYPQLAKHLHADPSQPASLNAPFIANLLREQMKFNGIVFTDDLMMGAVWGDSDPVEVALRALDAGADMLVYRRAVPEAWMAYEALLHRIRKGRYEENIIDEKLSRLLAVQNRLNLTPVWQPQPQDWEPETLRQLSLDWAREGITELHHDFISPLPLTHKTRFLLVAPDRSTMPHYAPDAVRSPELGQWFQKYGLFPQAQWSYSATQSIDTPPQTLWIQDPQVILFVAFNSMWFPEQQALYYQLKAHYSQAKMILLSLGMPTDADVLERPWIHWQLPHYRPSGMQALVQKLIGSQQPL